MNEEERWAHLIALDEELLKGGVILSEWCSFIVRETDLAFVNGAHLASILTAMSGIETYLRSEYRRTGKDKLSQLIDSSPLDGNLKLDLHKLRKYRNKWVHVEEPWKNEESLESSEIDSELENMAFFAVRTLRRTIYENPWI